MLPLTEKMPKALVPVLGEPFIAHVLRLLASNGFMHVVLCVGYRSDMIEEYVGSGSRFGLRVEYSHDGAVPIGTAGAVRRARKKLGDPFFVVYGDAYLSCDYAAVQRAFENRGVDGLVTVYHNRGALAPSNVMMRGGTIVRYEKGTTDPGFEYIDYGVEVFRSQAFDGFVEDGPMDLGSVVRALIAAGSITAFEVRNRFYEIGSPEGLAETTLFLKMQPRPQCADPLVQPHQDAIDPR